MTATPSDPSLRSMTALRIAMIRRRRMPNACSKKTEPCANCWPPRSAPSCLARPARSGAWPVADQRARGHAGTLAQPAWPRGRPAHHRQARGLGHAHHALYPGDLRRARAAGRVLEHTNSERTGASAASPCGCRYSPAAAAGLGQEHADSAPEEPRHASGASRRRPRPPPRHQHPVDAPARAPHADTPETETPATVTPQPAPAPAPVPTLRITEIPAEPRDSWLDALKAELQRCAGFFDRPDCAWAARRQYCEPKDGAPSRNALLAHERPVDAPVGPSAPTPGLVRNERKISGKAQQNAPRNAETTRQ